VNPRDGLYTLANDHVVDWLIALLESLRAHEPDLPVTVIPFDGDLARIRSLSGRYGFEVADDPRLEALDDIGRTLWPEDEVSVGAMRKLFAFFGPYERFLFLDSDVVVLEPLGRFFEAQRRAGCDFAFFDDELDMVYKPGDFRSEMVQKRGAQGFNTGAWGSRAGAFELAELRDLVTRARSVKHEFVDVLEQSLINYCVDVKGLSVCAFRDLVPHGGTYAGLRLRREGDALVVRDARRADSGLAAPFVHWSGQALGPLMPYRRLFLRYRLARMPSRLRRARYEARAWATLLLKRSELLRFVRHLRVRLPRMVQRHPLWSRLLQRRSR
jgi:hypothetical protein